MSEGACLTFGIVLICCKTFYLSAPLNKFLLFLCSSKVLIVLFLNTGTSLLQEVVYLVSQGADGGDPDEIGLLNIDEQLPVLEYPTPGLDIIQVR